MTMLPVCSSQGASWPRLSARRSSHGRWSDSLLGAQPGGMGTGKQLNSSSHEAMQQCNHTNTLHFSTFLNKKNGNSPLILANSHQPPSSPPAIWMGNFSPSPYCSPRSLRRVASPGTSYLDEGIACPIVRDGQPQSILRLHHLHFLGLAPDVCEDEVLQADLPPQQLLHVHFVGVECAKQDLRRTAHYCLVHHGQAFPCRG